MLPFISKQTIPELAILFSVGSYGLQIKDTGISVFWILAAVFALSHIIQIGRHINQ
jgi:hypothetical protein